MNNLNLLVCSSEYPPRNSSGMANVAYNIVERLKCKGIQCTICSPTGPDIALGSPQMASNFGILGSLYFWHEVAKYFEKYQIEYDMVWLHNPLILEGIPFKDALITMHTTYYGYLRNAIDPLIYYWIASKVESNCMEKIKRCNITGVSPAICKELGDMGLNKDNIKYIPNGVDCTRFRPSENKSKLREKFNLPDDDIIILSLGRLSDQKQPQKIIKLLSLIEKEEKDITFVLAGKGEISKFIKLAGEKDKPSKLKFLGYIDEKDVPELYACSDYYIMTSKYEGLPLTLLEALASGLPCIVSDIPNLRFIEKINAGIVLDFNSNEKDISILSHEIIEFVRKDNSSYSKNARDYALNHLDWTIAAESYIEEFRSLNETKK